MVLIHTIILQENPEFQLYSNAYRKITSHFINTVKLKRTCELKVADDSKLLSENRQCKKISGKLTSIQPVSQPLLCPQVIKVWTLDIFSRAENFPRFTQKFDKRRFVPSSIFR